jgi:chaperonin GroES
MLKPILDRVIIKRDKEETVTKGGLFIPNIAQKKNIFATVISAGPGRVTKDGIRVEPEVKVGDRVIIEEWVGQEITVDGEVCLVMKEESIVGVVEGGN